MNIRAQLVKLHFYNIFLSFRFTDAVWVVFLLSRGFTLAQVGVAEGVFHVTSFLCEVPTGIAADLLGRKRTLAVSGVCGVLSGLFMAFGAGFPGVCLSMAFNAMMYNFASGTQEAIAYDSLLTVGKSEDYLRVSAWLNGISSAVAAAGCLLGGAAILLGYVRAYLVNAAVGAAVVASALSLAEPAVTDAQRKRIGDPFAELGPRLKEHVRVSASFLKDHPRTACRILAAAGTGVPLYLSFMYLQQHLIDNGLGSAWLGAALLIIARLKMRLFPIAMLCALLAGAGTIAAGAEGCWPLSMLGAALTSFANGVAQLRVEAALNGDFPSDRRATLLSVNSMAYSMLMIAASPVSGAVGDALGTGWALRLLGGALIACALLFGPLYRARAAKGAAE